MIKSKINCNRDGGSLIEKQKDLAIKIEDHNYDDVDIRRRGKSVDMQNNLRGFYQNLRGSSVSYQYVQNKNPFTMIWATNPSPARERPL